MTDEIDHGPWGPPLGRLVPLSAGPAAWNVPACYHLSLVEIRLAMVHCKLTIGSVVGPVRGLLVGEDPGPNGRIPLFPWPHASSGGRCLKFSGLTVGEYLGRIRRINLFDKLQPRWSFANAQRSADRIKTLLRDDLAWRRSSRSDAEPLRVVLLGVRVAAAFGFDKPFMREEIDGHMYATIPHPSARNPAYNDPAIREGGEQALRWCAGYFG